MEDFYFKKERRFILYSYFTNLLEFNRKLAVTNNQKGIWLFVWKENERAIKFYKKNGFEVIGKFDYKISETHSNPNYQMFLKL